MIAVEILIEPLRVLVAALGTGVLAPGNPAEQIGRASAAVDAARRRSAQATDTALARWEGAGAAAAGGAAASMQRNMAGLADGGDEFGRLVEGAGRTVHTAAIQLSGLVDSFERRARGLAGGLFTPAGLLTILPVAVDHIGRGMEIVARTRADLRSDTDAMAALTRRIAPATITTGLPGAPGAPGTGGGLSTTPVAGGVPITLPDGSVAYAPDERAAKAVRAALSQRGVPYVWGGTTPNGFDCSGFTQWSYRQAGLELPRLAQEQDTAGTRVSQAQLQPGDLAVWSGHVAMYIGNGQMIEAGNPVGVSPVRTTNLDQVFEGFFRPR
ncbi:hydrolase Nlp/P60 [Gordonia jinghuaiqii]|uniref:C40 family peptidase n=1 Tax=Gordonia jinghuaiqii TaxID=2758710 RepID=A0A7D7LYX7_9ACTN|nr:C40 family peptidase [Gordonia jinghuaiqii]MCR5979958.1 hydrolase Nlp/P60 [Gordonia jinghuaiqii]QMT03158.1 C40 family peptidase [Gordonia jinghuaiqii]